jgi:hypothetical protein
MLVLSWVFSRRSGVFVRCDSRERPALLLGRFSALFFFIGGDMRRPPVGARRWTTEKNEYCVSLFEEGLTDAEVSRHMVKKFKGPCTEHAIRSKRGRLERGGKLKKGVAGSSTTKSDRSERKMTKKPPRVYPDKPLNPSEPKEEQKVEKSRPRVTLNRVEDGYCTFTDVWDAMKNDRIGRDRITKEGVRAFLNNHSSEIPLVAGVVIYDLHHEDGGVTQKPSRGLSVEGCRIALRVMCREGVIRPGKYRLPPRLGRQPVLDLTDVESVPAPQKELKREGWSENAKKIISDGITKSRSPNEIVSALIEGGHRGSPLKITVLQRQMLRMVPKYFSRDVFDAYRARFFHRKKKSVTAKKRKSKGKTKKHVTGDAKTAWTESQYKALAEISMSGSFRWSKTSGQENCLKIARVLVRQKVRLKATHQTVRNALRKLMKRPEGQRYGMTEQQYLRINDPKKYQPDLPGTTRATPTPRPQPAPAPEPAQSAVNGKNVLVNAGGLSIVLTPEQQKQAIEEYLTPEACQQAFQLYVRRLLNGRV